MDDERKNNIQYYSPDDSEMEPKSFARRLNGGVHNYDEVSPLVLTYDKTDSIPNQNENHTVTFKDKQWKALVTFYFIVLCSVFFVLTDCFFF